VPKKDIHIRCDGRGTISLFIAALEKSFPLFRRRADELIVDDSGKRREEKVFQTLEVFSTIFPQIPVDVEAQ